MISWFLGIAHALCGAKAYGALIRLFPDSGGEYLYLTKMLNPFWGRVAGFATLVLGFSMPVAVNAIAIGAFSKAIWPNINASIVAMSVLICVSGFHLLNTAGSKLSQNFFALIKIVFCLGFVLVFLSAGDMQWPNWQPPNQDKESSWLLVITSMFYVQFAFSGWNTMVYNASSFDKPRVTVPKAMLFSVCTVGVYYLVVNWIFVSELTPTESMTDFTSTTLAHVLIAKLLGAKAALVSSLFIITILFSSMSAMIMVAPHVTASMADDGALSKAFRVKGNNPSIWSKTLQFCLSSAIVFMASLRDSLEAVGAMLLLFTTAVSLALVLRPMFRKHLSTTSKVAALSYGSAGILFLAIGIGKNPQIFLWLIIPVLLSIAVSIQQKLQG